MALWQKESEAEDALYEDVFMVSEGSGSLEKVYQDTLKNIKEKEEFMWFEKNNFIANGARLAGNSSFGIGNFYHASIQYNKSLLYCEEGSENMGLSYANRSSCFFQMKMYEKCLVDIELAKKANYPQRLMAKLDKRRNDCEILKHDGLHEAGEMKLSFEPNEQIPLLANSVEIDSSQGNRRRVVATKDINVGQIILVEPSYVGELYYNKMLHCSICFSSNGNLVPCKDCSIAMFCHGKCENNNLHRFECGVKKSLVCTDIMVINIRIPLIRSIMLATSIFPTVDALIEFVEKTMISKASDVPQIMDEVSKYQTFLKLETKEIKAEAIPLVYTIYKMMMDQVEIAEIFNTKKYQRFLMHLIWQHFLILEKNAMIYRKNFFEPPGKVKKAVSFMFSFLKTFFHHSCKRNIALVINNGSIVGVVLRPIKEREELNFTIDEIISPSYADREEYLWKNHQLRCDCEICQSRSDLTTNSVLRVNANFVSAKILANWAAERDLTDKEAETMKVHCVSFLQTFGRYEWCEEITLIATYYEIVLAGRHKNQYLS